MFRLVLFMVFFANSLLSFGQFDTNYVHLTKGQFSVYPMAESAFMQLTFKDLEFDKGYYSSTLTSRNVTSIGFGMSFYRVGFSLSFQLPHSNIPGLEEAAAFSFAGGYSFRHLYGELRYRDYEGFQKSDLVHDSLLGSIELRKDVRLRQLGVSLDYFFSKKYNFDAAFKNYNVQSKSAATFLLMAGANRFDVSGKYLFRDTLNYTSEIELVREFDVYSFKIAPGGAATLTFKGVYISALLAVGATYNKNNFYGDELHTKVTTWAPVIESRAVVGYNSTKWFASFSLNIENDYFFFEKVDLSIMNVFFNLKAGYKFDAKHLGKIGKYL